MPPALSGQNNDYHSRHHRRQSSMSQSSLPDQLKNSLTAAYSPSRSAVYLPSTTYGLRTDDKTKSPPAINVSHVVTQMAGLEESSGLPQHSNDPDEFYREYQSQYSYPAGGHLQQGALQTNLEDSRTHHFVIASTLAADDSLFASAQPQQNSIREQDAKGQHGGQGTLRDRKPSVKNLVAQINASSGEEVPPIPRVQNSQPASGNISPTMSFAPGGHPYYNQAQLGRSDMQQPMNLPDHHGLGLMVHADTETGRHAKRKPLFGEIISNSAFLPAPGLDIHNPRRRSGSEGSPLLVDLSKMQEIADFGSDVFGVDGHDIDRPHSTTNSRHRRIHSESPLTPTGGVDEDDPFVSNPVFHAGISTQSNLRTPSPMIARADGKLQGTTLSRSSPRRRQRPSQIQSPGRSRKRDGTSGGLNSSASSLQANIITLPPKISPPLRSSRPRIPISSASTAASRARMEEKFTTMQKLHNEKRAADRRQLRPPELSDIDLKARRLRITQALSRSLEGQELRGIRDGSRRGTSSTRTLSPAYSDQSGQAEADQVYEEIHPSMSANGAHDELTNRAPQTAPQRAGSKRYYTHNALRAMSSSTPTIQLDKDDDDDSPTLGRDESISHKPSPIQTQHLQPRLEGEPSSATTNVTTETNFTHIDPEPQSNMYPHDTFEASAKEERLAVRRQNSAGTHLDSLYDAASDRADQESVRLVLRDTAYMDESEAIRTGYRQATASAEPVPDIPVALLPIRNSWATSSDEYKTPEHDISRLDSASTASDDHHTDDTTDAQDHERLPGQDNETKKLNRISGAYTIVKIVLQQHSTLGVVDQQFVDEVYERVLQSSPYESGSVDVARIEQICLVELQNRENSWRKSIIDSRNLSHSQTESGQSSADAGYTANRGAQPRYQTRTSASLVPPPTSRSHHYKSSLDSVEDWADTSPSVGDWMRFAVSDEVRRSMQQSQSALQRAVFDSRTTLASDGHEVENDISKNEPRNKADEEDPEMYDGPNGFGSPIPPAPPAKDTPLVEQKLFGALIEPPSVPQRLASLAQTDSQTTLATEAPVPGPKASLEDPEVVEQRRLRKRRNVIKELVDTEYTYEKDLKVVCGVYKPTATPALSEEDTRILFGNIEQVQEFAEGFLKALKKACKPSYVMERPERKSDQVTDSSTGSRPESSSSTLISGKVDVELTATADDSGTRIGEAFEHVFARMEKIYADYIRNRHAANLRLEAVQKSSAAREWLKQCRNNSSDITNAWNLDALLVKPVQRVTKYPLLLKELVDSTPLDHPDAAALKRAFHEVTEINIRINDVKKHTELVDQAFNRKRKDSDVRLGLSKAFGRRAEKLKQHLGTAEMFEDHEYNDIKIDYDNNAVHLMIVGFDCKAYGQAITKWIEKIAEIAYAAEAWVDVGPTKHPEAESKLRQLAMVTRGICTIVLPDHLEQLQAKVLTPIQSGHDLIDRFKNDQKGLLQKRDKRLIDYAQAKNRKDKGEKVDKKMAERMEQWEALNSEAKQRMKKLIKATHALVSLCYRNLLDMQMMLMTKIRAKLASAMGIDLEKLATMDIQREWQVDFDFQEASALSLSICNGALLAEAVNMLSFQTPSTLLYGDDSPRLPSSHGQHTSAISVHSNGSQTQLAESISRNSGISNRHNSESAHERSHTLGTAFSSNRERASSFHTSAHNRTTDSSSRNGGTNRVSTTRNENGVPRLSVDTPSPLIGSLSPTANKRPPSWSTFFSAATDVQSSPRHRSNGSSVFSSAMPMPNSPNTERQPETSSDISRGPKVLFTAASVYEFKIDRSRSEGGFPYLTYDSGEIFDIIGYNGALWLARNQDDPERQIGWIWEKHFVELAK